MGFSGGDTCTSNDGMYSCVQVLGLEPEIDRPSLAGATIAKYGGWMSRTAGTRPYIALLVVIGTLSKGYWHP